MKQMVSHCKNRLFVVEQMVNKFANLWFVVSQRCKFFVIQFQDGSLKLNWHLVLYPSLHREKQAELIAYGCHIHEHEMILCHGFEMRSSTSSHSFAPAIHRLNNVRTLGHWVFADDRFTYHPGLNLAV